jgi:N-carbamoylputrescine amidase
LKLLKNKVHTEHIKIGLIQKSCINDVAANLAATFQGIRNAASKGANIVCLQELFLTRYFCNAEDHENFKLAEVIPGPTTAKLQKLAAELNVVIIASLFEKIDAGIYFNTAAVIDADGSYIGKYRKNHIPDDPGFYEKFYFSPGDTGYQVFNTSFGRIGVLVCWDQWYPEAARITSLMGAQILFYPTAIGWSSSQPDPVNQEQYQAWQIIQRSHAIANGVHVVAVNRYGHEKEMNFWGGSFVANPFGTVLYQSPHDHEDIKVVEIYARPSY